MRFVGRSSVSALFGLAALHGVSPAWAAEPSGKKATPSAPASAAPSNTGAPAAPPLPITDRAMGSDGQAADVEPGVMARAKLLYERGASAYDAGRYYEAIEIFSETNRLYPNPQLSFNIAKAYDTLGSRSGALRYYLEYLRRAPEAPDRITVEARLRQLEAALAERGVQQINVLSEPAEALVFLDGMPVGLTPWTGETWPGKHQLSVQRTGFTRHEEVVELERLRASEVSVALTRARPAPAKPPPDTKLRWHHTHHTSLVTWICFGTATAALGTAIAIEATAGDKSPKIEPSTAFFAGLGAATAALGGVMLYFDLSADDPKPSGQRAAAARGRAATAGLSVRVAENGAFAGYSGVF